MSKPFTEEENERLRKFTEDLRTGRIKVKPFSSENFFDDEPEDLNYEVEDEEIGIKN